VKNGPKTLHEFFSEFIERHRMGEGESFQLRVTDEEIAQLGEFFIRGMVGWASGFDLTRELHPSHSSLAGVVVEAELEEFEIEDDPDNDDKALIH
jgi:hypothetical protein